MSVRLQPLVEQQNRAVEDFHAIGTVIPRSVFLPTTSRTASRFFAAVASASLRRFMGVVPAWLAPIFSTVRGRAESVVRSFQETI